MVLTNSRQNTHTGCRTGLLRHLILCRMVCPHGEAEEPGSRTQSSATRLSSQECYTQGTHSCALVRSGPCNVWNKKLHWFLSTEDWHTEEAAGLHWGRAITVVWHKLHPSDTVPWQCSRKRSYTRYLQQEQGMFVLSTTAYTPHQLIPECTSPVLCMTAWDIFFVSRNHPRTRLAWQACSTSFTYESILLQYKH